MKRCEWVDPNNELYVNYHDDEWGVIVNDDQVLFEFLILEGAQAGLSWITILKKREGYRNAFANFEAKMVAEFNESKILELKQDINIVRNELKIRSAVTNAKCFLAVQKEFGSFYNYLWRFIDNKPIVNHWKSNSEVPATSNESDIISKDLKRRGFKFVGSTIIYAFMQAVGMVNDHTTTCFRYGK